MTISADSQAVASDFVDLDTRDATPANDEGRVPKLGPDGKIDQWFYNTPDVFDLGFVLGASSFYSCPVFIDVEAKIGVSSTTLSFDTVGQMYQIYDLTNVWADADRIEGVVLLGDYVYVLLLDTDPATDVYRVYRLNKSDLTTATQMTFSGSNQLAATNNPLSMTSDGTDIYFTHLAGNSANQYAVGKYTLSGTVLTYDSTITCGSSAGQFDNCFLVDTDGNIYGLDSGTIDLTKFNSSGTQVDQADNMANSDEIVCCMMYRNSIYGLFIDTTANNENTRFIKIYHS